MTAPRMAAAALAGVPVGVQAQGVWTGRRQLFGRRRSQRQRCRQGQQGEGQQGLEFHGATGSSAQQDS